MKTNTDLITWLQLQLDTDERQAWEASPGPWHVNAEHDTVMAVDDIEVTSAFALSNNQLRHTAEFIAEHDPDRALRAVAAKRAILAQYDEVRDMVRNPVTAENRAAARIEQGALGDVLRALAIEYSDRAGYRSEWQPQARS